MFNHINLKKISGYYLSKKHDMHHLNYNEFNHDHISASKFKSNVIIHEDEDDCGMGGNAESLKTGNAGKRIACAVIGYSKENFKQ